MDGLEWKTLLKWMIWGYHYFRKHSYIPLGGGFKYFLFSPQRWWRFPIWLIHIFHMGWNHQLDYFMNPWNTLLVIRSSDLSAWQIMGQDTDDM